VIPGLEDLHLFVVGAVHEPMFVIDAAGPVAGQVTCQGFRLTYPGERGSRWISPIRRVILTAIFRSTASQYRKSSPAAGSKWMLLTTRPVDAYHYSPARAFRSSMVLTTAGWCDLSRATASMSRRALAGDRSR
jgi:hypothetical protein